MSDNVLSAFWLVGFLWGAVIAGLVFHLLVRRFPALEANMPIASMFGIIFFTAVTTAAGRDSLLTMGWQLLLVSILHNMIGLMLGYGSAGPAVSMSTPPARRARSRLSKRRHGVRPGRQDGDARHRRPCARRIQPVAKFRRLDPRQLLATAPAAND